MAKALNDNEELSFITLSAATKNVTRWLEPTEKQKKQRERDTPSGRDDNQDTEQKRAYVEHRLREISAWESKINGGRKA